MCALIAYEKALSFWPPISWKVAHRLRLFVMSTVTFHDISHTEGFVSAAVIFIVSEVLVIHVRGWSVIHNSYCGNNNLRYGHLIIEIANRFQ